MLPCFKCSRVFSNAIELCKHLKDYHEMNGRNSYLCLLCNSRFDYLWRYKKHLTAHHEINTMNQDDMETENIVFRRPPCKADLEAFKKESQSSTLDFACKVAGNMNIPRTQTFSVIDKVEHYQSSRADGLKTLMRPWVKDNKIHDFETSIKIIDGSFKKVNTEFKLDTSLRKKLLMSDLKRVKFDDDDDDNDSSSASDNNVEDTDNNSSNKRSKTATLMPIEFQFKSFFESGDVFKKIKSNTINIQEEGQLNHYINGTSWKAKRQNFRKDDLVIPYHFHIDDTQANNSLGTHRENGMLTCVYYSFPTIPGEYLSRLDNIFTAMLFQTSQNKSDRCYTELIDELNKLADDGIILNIEGKEEKVFFVLGLVLGDNKGANECLGFSGGFNANYYCRFCRLRSRIMKRSYREVSDKLRNKENFEADLLKQKFEETGIHKNSAFNRIRFYHCTDSGADVMHDVNLGILHYNLCEVLLYFIDNGYFSLHELNLAKRNLKYGEIEENNKTVDITENNLKSMKLVMTASESFSFAHHLPFILLNIMNVEMLGTLEHDEFWQFLLFTIRFMDMSYLPSFTDDTIESLADIIEVMNSMYVRLFYQTLKPKHHFATHYPTLIRKFGPLRFISSMRYEANHRFLKNYTKNTVSRKDLSYSIGRKLQYNFASLLQNSSGLKDIFKISRPKLTKLCEENFYPHIVPNIELNTYLNKNIYVSNKVTVNGYKFSSALYLPYLEDNQLRLFKIIKIIFLSKDDLNSIRIVCQKFMEVTYKYIAASYTASNLRSEIELVKISDVFRNRMFSVALHEVNGEHLFRYKHF